MGAAHTHSPVEEAEDSRILVVAVVGNHSLLLASLADALPVEDEARC